MTWLRMGAAWLSLLVFVTALIGCVSHGDGNGNGKLDGGGGTSGSGGGGSGGDGGGSFTRATKLDLLFMVDNSIGMADKHQNLLSTIPSWIEAFTNPPVDPATGEPYFAPIEDIHIGVISSSLGSHGGDICSPASGQFNETQNDRAHLLPSVRPNLNLESFQGLGFLWWDPNQTDGGETDKTKLITNLIAYVQSAGEVGCGYEAGLEAMYRFLVDPAPPLDMAVEGGVAQPTGVDGALLQQRSDFLRPDSAIVVVALSDENDCSIIDGEQNWIAAQAGSGGGAFQLPKATTTCETDPDSSCCRSCAVQETSPPAGCAPVLQDANCAFPVHDGLSDHLNVRCFHQKQRFGLDFLYPVQRYVEALTQPTMKDGAGDVIDNPLVASRGPALITFVPIVGVPWQDLATESSLAGDELEYQSAADLAASGRWSWLVPECSVTGPDGQCDEWNAADQPDDPLMIESIAPRGGVNPATNTALVDSSGPVFGNGSPPNGHEYMIPAQNDLQYACIFELPTPRDCNFVPNGTGCDCEPDPDPTSLKSPLCQQSDGSYGTEQRFAKGYPGTRYLQVAKDLGDQAVVGSICPKSLVPGTTSYAYTALTKSLLERLSSIMVQ